MSSNCKEFNFLIDRKNIYTENDIPSLIAYNKCLNSEIDTLNYKVNGLDESQQVHSEKLGRLEEQVSALKDIQLEKIKAFDILYSEKLAKLENTQTIGLSSYQSMFETSKSMYSDTLTSLSIVMGIAGIFAICSLAFYKKREIDKLKDESFIEVKKRLDSNSYTQGLVANALDTVFISARLDSKLEEIAANVEARVLNTLADRDPLQNRSDGSEPDLNSILRGC